MAQDSKALIDAACAGDRGALEDLIAQNVPGLRAYIRLHAGPRVRAKETESDILQSVCREVLAGLDGFEYEGEARFRQWLYTMALRKIIEKDRYWRAARRDARREAVPPDLSEAGDDELHEQYSRICTPSRIAAVREELRLLETSFDRLPEDYREVILLAKLIGLTSTEIAERLGKSEGAVRTLLSRALARLSGLLVKPRPDP